MMDQITGGIFLAVNCTYNYFFPNKQSEKFFNTKHICQNYVVENFSDASSGSYHCNFSSFCLSKFIHSDLELRDCVFYFIVLNFKVETQWHIPTSRFHWLPGHFQHFVTQIVMSLLPTFMSSRHRALGLLISQYFTMIF